MADGAELTRTRKLKFLKIRFIDLAKNFKISPLKCNLSEK